MASRTGRLTRAAARDPAGLNDLVRDRASPPRVGSRMKRRPASGPSARVSGSTLAASTAGRRAGRTARAPATPRFHGRRPDRSPARVAGTERPMPSTQRPDHGCRCRSWSGTYRHPRPAADLRVTARRPHRLPSRRPRCRDHALEQRELQPLLQKTQSHRYFGIAPATARSLVVPCTASEPISPPGNSIGCTAKLSVVNTRSPARRVPRQHGGIGVCVERGLARCRAKISSMSSRM